MAETSDQIPLVIHFLVPFTMKCLPSGVLVAVVVILATSDPAAGSVIAMHVRFLPVSKSGRKRSWSCLFPNLIKGGTPKATKKSLVSFATQDVEAIDYQRVDRGD